MPLSSLIGATVETTLNKLLALSSNSDTALDALSSKTVHIKLNEYKEPLYFYIANRRIEVFGQYEGDISVSLTLGFDTLIALKNKKSISELIKNDQLIIDGDIKVLQQFSDLITELDIDWTEHLSAYTGDVLAHRLAGQAKKASNIIKQQSEHVKHSLADYLKHETKLAVSPLEYVHFCDQVSDISQQVEQLSQRVNQLEKS